MHSLILQTGTRLITVLMLLFSIFILWRGHNEPGGGFIGGLIAATAFALHGAAFGADAVRRLLPADPRTILACGLVAAIISGLFALFGEGGPDPFMTGRWVEFPNGFALGTPVLFDIGVYLVVVGGLIAMVLALMEED
ncbi:Na+/H+ antiporter subunit B [Indioceanicola profundi]|uniref:Na+/H+ antiporter subunit B n=1 Tax=Indioceanicola profundi TaxID=2220096 RepID=UPI000E6AAFF8|nr:Na+/H+ antiporter subunit B [Indioceanicola profundi]